MSERERCLCDLSMCEEKKEQRIVYMMLLIVVVVVVVPFPLGATRILEETHVNAHAICHTLARTCPASIFDPPSCGEVGTLRDVESVVEATVVSTWEGEDEVAWSLDHLDVRYVVIFQKLRRHDNFLVSEKLLALLEKVRRETHAQLLESFLGGRWYEVPRFRRARVKVVDAVQVEVLRVVREHASPRSKVQVRAHDARYVYVFSRECSTEQSVQPP